MRRSRRQSPPTVQCVAPSAAALHAHSAQKGSRWHFAERLLSACVRARAASGSWGLHGAGGCSRRLAKFDRWVCPAAAYKGRACKRGRHSPAIT